MIPIFIRTDCHMIDASKIRHIRVRDDSCTIYFETGSPLALNAEDAHQFLCAIGDLTKVPNPPLAAHYAGGR